MGEASAACCLSSRRRRCCCCCSSRCCRRPLLSPALQLLSPSLLSPSPEGLCKPAGSKWAVITAIRCTKRDISDEAMSRTLVIMTCGKQMSLFGPVRFRAVVSALSSAVVAVGRCRCRPLSALSRCRRRPILAVDACRRRREGVQPLSLRRAPLQLLLPSRVRRRQPRRCVRRSAVVVVSCAVAVALATPARRRRRRRRRRRCVVGSEANWPTA